MSRMRKGYWFLFLLVVVLTTTAGAIGSVVSRSSSIAIQTANADQVVRVSQRFIKEQELRISLDSKSNDLEVAVTRTLSGVSEITGCSNPVDLICLNIKRIQLGGKVFFSVQSKIEYTDDQRNRAFLYSTTNFSVLDTHSLTLQISDGHWRRLLVNGQVVQATRFPFQLGVTGQEKLIGVRWSKSNSFGDSKDNKFHIETSSDGKYWNLMFFTGAFVLFFSLLSCIAQNSKLNNRVGRLESLFSQVIVLSGLITVMSYIMSSLGVFGNLVNYDSSGIFYIRIVRFTDFFEVWNLHEFRNLYSSLTPDYPPITVSILQNLSSVLLPEHALVIVIGCAFLTHYVLIYGGNESKKLQPSVKALFFALTSAPLLFAIDRGGLDLLIYPMLVFGVIWHSQSRFKLANSVFALAAAFKFLPIVFVVTSFRTKRAVREILSAVLTVVSLNLLAAAILPELGVSEFFNYFKKVIVRPAGEISDSYMVFNNSLWSLSRVIEVGSSHIGFGAGLDLGSVLMASSLLLVAFSGYWVLFRSETTSGRLMIALCTMILIVPISGNYRLLYLYPAIWYLDNERVIHSLLLRNCFVASTSLLLSICPIFYFSDFGVNLGQIIKPFLLLFIMLITCFSDDSRRSKKLSTPVGH